MARYSWQVQCACTIARLSPCTLWPFFHFRWKVEMRKWLVNNTSVYFFSSPGLLEHDFVKKTAREKRWSARVSRLKCTRSPRPVDRAVGRNAPSRTQKIILQVVYILGHLSAPIALSLPRYCKAILCLSNFNFAVAVRSRTAAVHSVNVCMHRSACWSVGVSLFALFESVCACMCVDCIDVCFESDRLPAKKDFTRWKPVQLASETYDNTPHWPCSSTSKLLEDHKRFFCQALRSRRSWWSMDLFQ